LLHLLHLLHLQCLNIAPFPSFVSFTYSNVTSLLPSCFFRNKRKRSQESGNITNEASDEHNYDSIDTNTRRTGAPRARKQSKKTTELKNFYRFQIKEEKIKDLDNLRKKFAEDRERVAKMKEQRKFKPF